MKHFTKDQMRQMGFHNSYDIARVAKNNLFIDYAPGTSGLAAHYAYWQVVGVNMRTDPQGHWLYGKNKTFTVHGRDEKVLKLKEAMEWCHRKYGTLGFEKDPFGGHQIMGTMRRILLGRRT